MATQKVLPRLVESNRKFDLIFIDGGHDYDVVKSDLSNAIKLSDSNTLIIVDDVHYPTSKDSEAYFDSHPWTNKSLVRVNKEQKITEVDYVRFVTNNTNLRSLLLKTETIIYLYC